MTTHFFKDLRYYFFLFKFKFKEPFSDLKATGITYALYCFFIWILAHVWLKFNSTNSVFTFETVIVYIGISELFFMSFLSTRQLNEATEDFSLFLARPRSWLGREIIGNMAMNFGKRSLYLLTLILFIFAIQITRLNIIDILLRASVFLILLALPQALLATMFSTLKLSYPQTDYFVLPFSKLFLALGGVFGPLSDYGEPWRSIFLKMPGSDLFFQPAYFVTHGSFYQMTFLDWLTRIIIIQSILIVIVLFYYRKGRKNFQSWGG